MTKAEQTKQFILETAAIIYNEKGLAGTCIDDILAATGLTKGCLYSHFENKEDLTLQVTDYLLKRALNNMISILSSPGSAKHKIFEYLDYYKLPMHPQIQGGCPVFNMAVEADDNHPKVKKMVSESMEKAQNLLTHLLAEGIQKKEFRPSLDAEAFAFKLLAAIEGAIVICRTRSINKPMQALIRSLKAEMESYACTGKE
jgi:TetR/AcrR family transcriptional repressor of nem operon